LRQQSRALGVLIDNDQAHGRAEPKHSIGFTADPEGARSAARSGESAQHVVRKRLVIRIASQDLVEGDRLIVQECDRLTCNAGLVESYSMRVDESLLTGESAPVDKGVAIEGEPDRVLHAGTLIVHGDGVAQVTATGIRTTLGGSLASLRPHRSRLHAELKRLLRNVALVALLTCVLAAAVSRERGETTCSWSGYGAARSTRGSTSRPATA
jgi:P-type E1-E2 ATPase